MDIVEYKERLKEIRNECKKRELALASAYAKSNSSVVIGDSVLDHIGAIKVEQITLAKDFNGIPYCVYFGPELKKDGNLRKDGRKRHVHQINIID